MHPGGCTFAHMKTGGSHVQHDGLSTQSTSNTQTNKSEGKTRLNPRVCMAGLVDDAQDIGASLTSCAIRRKGVSNGDQDHSRFWI